MKLPQVLTTLRISILLVPIMLMFTACSPNQSSCDDARELLEQCQLAHDEHVTNCSDEYEAIFRDALGDEINERGDMGGSVASQPIIEEIWNEYEECVAAAPSCDEEEAHFLELCEE